MTRDGYPVSTLGRITVKPCNVRLSVFCFLAIFLGGQTMASKLYVGNLAYSVTNADLEALFSQAGAVESVAVITDKFSGQSKGFGFVEMADSADAARAIEQFNETEL